MAYKILVGRRGGDHLGDKGIDENNTVIHKVTN